MCNYVIGICNMFIELCNLCDKNFFLSSVATDGKDRHGLKDPCHPLQQKTGKNFNA